MPSVIDRACRTLRDRGVVCDASEDGLVVPPGAGDGFEVTLRIVHDRQFVVTAFWRPRRVVYRQNHVFGS